MNDYVQEYIAAVESGRIIVGNKIQKPIDRHKRDLIKSQSDQFVIKSLKSLRLSSCIYFSLSSSVILQV